MTGRYGRIDIVVNVAAIYGEFAKIERLNEEPWDRYIEVNLNGTFHVIRAVIPTMIAQRYGRIVNISSASSLAGGYKQAHYAAAKAAVEGLARSVALEYASVGITCNCVAPGPIITGRIRQTPPDIASSALRAIPAGREMTDVAEPSPISLPTRRGMSTAPGSPSTEEPPSSSTSAARDGPLP